MPTAHWGLGLLNLAIVAFVAAMWWGTSLSRAISPSFDSRAYVRASLRACRFRAWLITWISLPYALLSGLALRRWHRWSHAPGFDGWDILYWSLISLAAALVGRHFGPRKYHRLFGPTVRELEKWKTAWPEEASATKS